MAATQNIWLTVKNVTWLILALGCFLILFIGWVLQFKAPTVQELTPIEKNIQMTTRLVQAETVANTQLLGSFTSEVPQINLSKRIIASGVHGPEFRGTKFVTEYQKMWTLQIMQVSEEDIIRAYLDKRTDRDKFYYIRITKKDQPEQFVLMYGVFKTVEQTLAKTQTIKFSLPDSVKTMPEKISSYVNDVNDLGSEEVGKNQELRSVVLRKAAIPKYQPAVAKPKNETLEKMAGTTITVQRSDQNGEIKSTQVEQNQPLRPQAQQNVPAANSQIKETPQVEQQIIDPF